MTMNLMEVSVFVVVFILLLSVLLCSGVIMGMISDAGDFVFAFFNGGLISVLVALGSSTLVHYVGLLKGLSYLAIALLVILLVILVVSLIKINFDLSMTMAIGLVASILFDLALVTGFALAMITNAHFFL